MIQYYYLAYFLIRILFDLTISPPVKTPVMQLNTISIRKMLSRPISQNQLRLTGTPKLILRGITIG